MSDLPSAAQRLRAAISQASRGLVEREALVELVALSAQLHGALLEARLRDLLRP